MEFPVHILIHVARELFKGVEELMEDFQEWQSKRAAKQWQEAHAERALIESRKADLTQKLQKARSELKPWQQPEQQPEPKETPLKAAPLLTPLLRLDCPACGRTREIYPNAHTYWCLSCRSTLRIVACTECTSYFAALDAATRMVCPTCGKMNALSAAAWAGAVKSNPFYTRAHDDAIARTLKELGAMGSSIPPAPAQTASPPSWFPTSYL